jgi:Ca2+-binding EF-hand superfamily protein
MNKRQFHKFYKRVAGINDENSQFAEYAYEFFTFADHRFSCFRHAFAIFDTNHDGSIDFSEFVLAATIKNKDNADSALELVFAM